MDLVPGSYLVSCMTPFFAHYDGGDGTLLQQQLNELFLSLISASKSLDRGSLTSTCRLDQGLLLVSVFTFQRDFLIERSPMPYAVPSVIKPRLMSHAGLGAHRIPRAVSATESEQWIGSYLMRVEDITV